MFYEQSEITDLFKCQHCKQKYDKYRPPRMLPCCSKTICYKCVFAVKINMKNKTYQCMICEEFGHIPAKGFPINEVLVQLIEKEPNEIYRGAETEKLKNILNDLENSAEKLSFEVENTEYIIKEECSEQRRLVLLAREERIEEINQLSDKLIEKIDIYQQLAIHRYYEMNESTRKLKELIYQVNISILQHKLYLNQLKIEDKQTNILNEKLKELKRKVEKERGDFRNCLFDNKILKFETNKTPFNEKNLGILENKTNVPSKILCCGARLIRILDLDTSECLNEFLAHSNFVKKVKLLNKTKIISCSDDRFIKIWDLKNYSCLKIFKGHSKIVRDIEVISDEKIASCSDDETIRIWNVESGICLHILDGHSSWVFQVRKLSEDFLLSSGDSIKLWNLETCHCIKTFLGHNENIYCLEILTHKRFVSCSKDKTIKVWNLNKGDCLQTLKGHTDAVYCIQALSDEMIISGSKDCSIKLWCLKTNSCLKTLTGHSKSVSCIQIILDNQVASCSDDKTIRIWDLYTGDCIKKFQKTFSIHVIALI